VSEQFLDKNDLSVRYKLSVKSISSMCSRNKSALPPFIKLGSARNSPIRWRLKDCLEWEEHQAEIQRLVTASEQEPSLEDLLGA
jgi:hypothetical protein